MRFTTAIFSTVSALALVSSAAPTAGLSVERSITRPKSNIVSRPSTPRYKVRGQRRHSSSKNRVRRQRRQSDGDLSSGVLSPTGPVGKTTTALLGNRGSSVSDGEDPNEDLLISVSNVAEEIPAELNDVTNTAQEIIEDVTNTVKEIIDDVTTVASDPSSSLVGIENEARTAALRKLNTPSVFLLSRTTIGFVSIMFDQRNRSCPPSSVKEENAKTASSIFKPD